MWFQIVELRFISHAPCPGVNPRFARQVRNGDDLKLLREEDPYFAGTRAKGLLILQSFVSEPRAHANSEFAQRLGLPRSTVFRLCRTLHSLGFPRHRGGCGAS
jgi:hypothetical protein